MKITMIGTGYVGLVSGACFAEFGYHVTCVDKNAEKISALKNGIIPIFEPGLDDLVMRNAETGRLEFTGDIGKAVSEADVVFIAVGTPQGNDRRPDLTYARAAAKEIAAHLSGYTVVVNKSTVPVGFAREVQSIIRAENPKADFDVCSNPEFLREGSAIGDFMRPDRVVVGVENDRAAQVMKNVYRPLYLIETPIVLTGLETAELTKYAGNAFLATKITFINEIANLCEKVGADVQDVAKGIGLDGRIGKKFLHAGPGYGGSCFPKDTSALAEIGIQHGAPQQIVETVIKVNTERKFDMAARIVAAAGGDIRGKTVGVLGLTFKPNTDDMRDSVSLSVLPTLAKAGANVRAFDPAGMNEAKKLLADCAANISYVADAYAAAEGADVLVVLTEWNEFRALDLKRAKSMMKNPVLVDLRNIYNPVEARELGFVYMGVGRN
ncbi:MAG: UDP-glucose/GDP-mannose dehydrogenase family protein [Bdellovibrionales bacterium]